MAIWVIVASSIVLLPGGLDRWVLPKLAVAVIGIALAASAPATGRLPRWLTIGVAATAVVLVAAASLAADPWPQLIGRWPRYEGLVALPVVVGLLWAGARLLGPGGSDAADRRRHLVLALATASAAIAVVAVVESLGMRPIASTLARPGSLLGNASDQGVVGVLMAATLGVVAIGQWRRTARVPLAPAIGAAAAVISAVLSASRGAMVALMVVAVVVAVVMIVTSPRRWRAALITSGAVAIVAIVIVAVPMARDRILAESPLAAQTVLDRWQLAEASWRLLADRPWLGVGPSGFADALPGVLPDDWFARVGAGTVTDSPHALPLQVLLAGGLVGAVLATAVLVAIVVAAVAAIRSSPDPVVDDPGPSRRLLLVAALTGVVGAGIALSLHFTIASTSILIVPLVGLLVAVPLASPGIRGARGPDPRWVRRSTTAVAGVWAVALAVLAIGEIPLRDGVLAAQRGDIAAATSSFELAAAMRPVLPDTALVAAEALAGAADAGLPGAAEAGIVWGSTAVERLPVSVRALEALAVSRQGLGDLGGAIDALTLAADRSPASPSLQLRLGLLHAELGEFDRAVVRLLRAVELDPGTAAGWDALAAIAGITGDAGLAERVETQRPG